MSEELRQAQAEVTRLTGCLTRANSNMETMERDLYLRLNKLEAEAECGLCGALITEHAHDYSDGMIRGNTICPKPQRQEFKKALTASVEAMKAMKESLGEYVRQSMYFNPEWSVGLKRMDESIATTEALLKR